MNPSWLPENSPPEKSPLENSHPRKIPPTVASFFSGAMLFRFVARFARVRIQDYSRKRFESTAYFAKPDYVASMHAYTCIT